MSESSHQNTSEKKSLNHVAIVMDGNGRWAKQRFLPRVAGHKVGVDAVKKVIKTCINQNIKVLTLFAFSSENWKRPQEEVSILKEIFLSALAREIKSLHSNNIRFRTIGDITPFGDKLCTLIKDSEKLTQNNTALCLNIAVNYGGRWDIIEAIRQFAKQPNVTLESLQNITESDLENFICLHNVDISPPDLFIRTGGEQRISNFLLWQIAYSELYFTKTYWPDFDESELLKAIDDYQSRERRFGCISEQLIKKS